MKTYAQFMLLYPLFILILVLCVILIIMYVVGGTWARMDRAMDQIDNMLATGP